MNSTKLIYRLLFLLFGFCTYGSNATLSVEELKSGITELQPIYHVPQGQLPEVLNGLKEYNLITLVTTSAPQYKCALCEQFDPIYSNIIRSIYKAFPQLKDHLFFVRVEASKHLDQLRALNIASVPQIWGFPESKRLLGNDKYDKIKALLQEKAMALANDDEFFEPDWYDLNQAGMEHFTFELKQGDQWEAVLERFVDFIGNTISMDLKPGLKQQLDSGSQGINWFTIIQWIIYASIFLKLLQKLKKNTEEGRQFWKDKRLYGYLCLVLIFISVSGFNFATQRKTPFISQKDGNILWIAPVSNTQFGAEIILSISLQVFFLAICIYLFQSKQILSGYLGQGWIELIGASLLMLALILGANVYNIKDGGYPYNYIKIF